MAHRSEFFVLHFGTRCALYRRGNSDIHLVLQMNISKCEKSWWFFWWNSNQVLYKLKVIRGENESNILYFY